MADITTPLKQFTDAVLAQEAAARKKEMVRLVQQYKQVMMFAKKSLWAGGAERAGAETILLPTLPDGKHRGKVPTSIYWKMFVRESSDDNSIHSKVEEKVVSGWLI